MTDLILIALAGFFAAMADGALGMGFGPTSATILLSSGASPAATSTIVNLAKVATGLASGVSHWRFGNIDRGLVRKLALPGAVGALIGTTVLSTVDGDSLRPVLSIVLLVVGIRILVRFSRPLPKVAGTGAPADDVAPDFDDRGLRLAGAAGGVTNGLVGTWGPVVTPFLLHRGLPPRYAVGSVNTAEVAVAVVSVGSLVTSMGSEGVEVPLLLAMLAGGVLAAPLAAHVVRYVPARLLGLAVAGLLLLTQTRELEMSGTVPFSIWFGYVAIPLALVYAGLRPKIVRRRLRAAVARSTADVH